MHFHTRVLYFTKAQGFKKPSLVKLELDNKDIYEDPQEKLFSGPGIIGHLLIC